MSAVLNSLNVHNFPIFQPILMKLVSKFMVYRVLSDKTYLLSGLLSPLNDRSYISLNITDLRCTMFLDCTVHSICMIFLTI